MRISDWSSDVCSSDLFAPVARAAYPGLLTPFDHVLDGGPNIFNGGPGDQSFSVSGIGFFDPLEDILNGDEGFDTLVISATLTTNLGQCLVGFDAITITAGAEVIIAEATVLNYQGLKVEPSASP